MRRAYPPLVEHRLRMTHDPEADAAYIYVSDAIAPGGVAQSKVLDHYTPGAAVTLDFDADNRLLGIELLGFSRLVTDEVRRRIYGDVG
jgi:uncharacterized protein YuzE